MTDHDPHRDPDRELQDYLRGSHPLSARYRASSRETTTPELDAAVLQHARAAVQQPLPAMTAKPSWQQRWAVPVGIAATLLIGVDLAWRVNDRAQAEERARETVAVAAAEPAPTAVARAAQFPPAPAAGAVPSSPPPAVAAPPQATMQPAPASSPAAVAADTAAPPPASQDAVAESFALEAETQHEDAGVAIAAAAAAEQQQRERQQKSAESGYSLASKQRSMAMVAPPPAVGAMAPAEREPEIVIPRRSVDEAKAVAENLAALLRAGSYDELKSRYQTQLTRQALDDAGAVFAGELTPRYAEDADGTWRVDFLDADKRLRCTARLRPTAAGWMLVELVTRPG